MSKVLLDRKKAIEEKIMKRLTPIVLLLIFIATAARADQTTETSDQREFIITDYEEEPLQKIESLDAIYEKLKARAEAKMRKKKYKNLRKFKAYVELNAGYESNPTQASDDAQGDPIQGESSGDMFFEEGLSLRWLPEFGRKWKAEAGYRLYNVNYVDESDIDLMSHRVHGSIKYYPFKKFKIEPGVAYTYNDYPNDDRSTSGKIAPFIKVSHYIAKKWNYGIKYEYSDKEYAERLARTTAGIDIPGNERTDKRHTYNAFVTRYLDTWRLRFRYRYYDNNSDDQFLDTYDFNSHRYYVTLSKSFFDKKLNTSFTPSYEKRDYDDRLSGPDSRKDDVMHYHVHLYYKHTKQLSFHYRFSARDNDSNSPSGNFTNITNSVGLRYRF